MGDGALHRLAAKSVEGLRDPAVFDKLASASQERPVKSGYGWVFLYRERHFGRMPDKIEQPIGHRWLGGDVDVLMRVFTAK